MAVIPAFGGNDGLPMILYASQAHTTTGVSHTLKLQTLVCEVQLLTRKVTRNGKAT